MAGIDTNQAAFQMLLHAEQFEVLFLGIAAQPSSLVAAFRGLLLDEPNADGIFKDLLENATPAGKLYALCGLYFTDHAFFTAAVEKYRDCQDVVVVQSGCLGFGKPFSEILENKTPNAIRLPDPSASLLEWRQSHPEANNPDIIGGGYPHMFGKSFPFG